MGYKKREFQKELEKYLKDPDNGPRLLSLSNSAQGVVFDEDVALGIQRVAAAGCRLVDALKITAFGDSLPGYGERFLTYADIESGGRLRAGGVVTHGGWTTTQLAAVVSEIDAFGDDQYVFVMAGANDALTGVANATTLANLESIYQQIIDKGHTPIPMTPPPQADTSKRLAVREIVAGVRDLSSRMGLRCVPVYENLVDTSTGGWLSGYDVGDGTHFSPLAVQKVGQVSRDTVLPLAPYPSQFLQTSAADATNLLANALATVDTDANGVPDSWTLYQAPSATGITNTLVDDVLLPGRFMRATLASASRNSRMGQRKVGGFVGGQTVRFACRLRSGQSGANGKMWVYLTWYLDYGGTVVRSDTLLGGVSQKVDEGLLIRDVVVPATATQVECNFYGGSSNPASTGNTLDGWYEIGQPTLRVLP